MNAHLTATALDRATQDDAQFRVPERPRVVPAVPIIQLPDALVIEGVVSRRVLRGKTAERLVPDLVPLLDGTRTWGELAAAMDVSEATIRQVLGILYSAGLLEDGADDALDPSSSLGAFLSRTVDATRHHRSGSAAAAALSSAPVAVLTDGDADADALVDALRANGMRAVSDDEVLRAGHGLIVTLSTEDAPMTAERTATFRAAGVPVLPVVVRTGALRLGPVSYPDHNPCPDCSLHGLEGHESESDSTSRSALVDLRDLSPAFIAHEAVLLLAGVGTARTTSEAIVIDNATLRTRYEIVTRRPACNVCGVGRADNDTSPAFAYEESVAFPPSRLTKPRSHQHHFEAANIALSTEQRRVEGERLMLPGLEDPVCDNNATAGISQILARAFAFKPPHLARGGKVRRWAPTGGNLGSPQAYFTARSVPGLPDGRWMYRGDECAAYRVADAGPGPQGVELIIVSELYRVWKKYNTFAYRVVALDTGVALSHIAITAASLGVPVANHFGWDTTQLAAAYHLDEREQMVTAVLSIGVVS